MKLHNTNSILQVGHKPKQEFYQKIFTKVLQNAENGLLVLHLPNHEQISIGKGEKKAEIFVLDERFFKKSILHGDIGFGEAYVEGMWDSPDVLAVLNWFLANSRKTPTFAESQIRHLLVNSLGFIHYIEHLLRPNSIKKAQENISYHYDLSNELYKLMLDKTMAYSCGLYLSGKESLEEAQKNKYEAICRKLNLKPNDKVLEIGSGWGGFAVYAAKKYKVHVTTITISKEQFLYVKELIQKEKLENQIEIRLQDYREVKGQFDKIVSIEMIEALGYQYYDAFFSQIHKLLKENGIVVLQCITYPDKRFSLYRKRNDWIQKYIFPGSLLLSLHEIRKSLLRTGDLEIYDMESMGQSYVKTLKAWQKNFNKHQKEILALGFDNRFIRMWNYYLWYCQAGFAHRYINVVQLRLARPQNLLWEDYHGLF